MMAISFRSLLLPYLFLLPSVLGLLLLDQFVFGRTMRASFSGSPESVRWFTLFFVWPHIFASQFTLCDREYLVQYRYRLGIGIPLAVGAATVISWFDQHLTTGQIYFLITLYHTLFQQIGVAHVMLRQTDRWFQVWKWGVFGAMVVGAICLHLQAPFWVLAGIAGLLFALTEAARRVARQASTSIGRWYVWANQGMFLLMAVCGLLQYPFLTILPLRVVHDITAFLFYVSHDHNRNRFETKNFLYRIGARLNLPAAFQGLVLAFGLNAFVHHRFLVERWPALFASLGLVHYYTESFIWKRHAVHRQAIAFRG